ncbi:hypothetical protein EJ08DRAFT_720092 [Tothia fuscella]|uniref:Uncharacterized protein n=1 Tax=Tothia fuscella TaxID=1048955 RepID=A0A9P4NM99_9PEZI|nr:hypothetical protein EJ08DRAFT_720092 [Tothia fuscella]
MFGGKVPTINELQYRVYLKSYATHNDTLQLLQSPLLHDTPPVYVYDRGRNRGFVVNITLQQVCDVYKLPIVNTMDACICRDKNEKQGASQPGLPRSNSGIKDAPAISNLTEECSRIAWYSLAFDKPQHTSSSGWSRNRTLGEYVVSFKSHIPEAVADQIMYSPEFASATTHKSWSTPSRFLAVSFYMGNWTLTQLCALEKMSEVSHAGVSVVGPGTWYMGPQ